MLSMKRDAKKPTKARQRQNLLSCLRTIVWTSGLLSGNVLLSVDNSIRTLLRGRNVDDLHRRVQQWLTRFL
jgi:hypothetical protein